MVIPSTLGPAAAAAVVAVVVAVAALYAVDDALLADAAAAPLVVAVAVVHVLGLLQSLDNPCEILKKDGFFSAISLINSLINK